MLRSLEALLRETGSDAALDALRRLAAAQWRKGAAPLCPSAFGAWIADTAGPGRMR
jgi:hypothetical protein